MQTTLKSDASSEAYNKDIHRYDTTEMNFDIQDIFSGQLSKVK